MIIKVSILKQKDIIGGASPNEIKKEGETNVYKKNV